MSTTSVNPEGGIPAGQAPPKQTAHGRRWLLFRLAAVLVGLLPFVLLELGLRVLDIGRPSRLADPLAGFSRQMPLFERSGLVYRTIRSREPYFGPQEFLADKPTNGFRVFCFGGSTIYGHPYLSDTALPKWLELELAGSDPSRHIEAVNCGGISYASYRLAPIVHEVLQYQPDLIVVATGENEFLEDRTYHAVKSRSRVRRWVEDKAFSLRTVTCAMSLARRIRGQGPPLSADDSGASTTWSEVNTRLDDARTGYASYRRDDAWHRQVVSQFEESLRTMIGECKAARVPIILVTLGSNVRDCPPYKSEHRSGITPEEEGRWQAAFDAGAEAEQRDLNEALAFYRKATEIDGEHALLAFHMARCLDRLGQTDRARESYLRAKDQDICPLRMLEEIYKLQYAIAAETGTPIVDARKAIEAVAADGLPGNDVYLDHVHPTIGGNQMIARGVAGKVHDLRILPGERPWSIEDRRTAYHQQFQRLDSAYFTNGRRRVDWLENWARRQRLFAETLPKDSRGFLHGGYRQLEIGEDEQAWKSFQAAMEKDSGTMMKLVNHALVLREQGRLELAQDLLNRLAGVVQEAAVKAGIARASQLLEADLARRNDNQGSHE